jgi:hypothetical protein
MSCYCQQQVTPLLLIVLHDLKAKGPPTHPILVPTLINQDPTEPSSFERISFPYILLDLD